MIIDEDNRKLKRLDFFFCRVQKPVAFLAGTLLGSKAQDFPIS